MCNNSILNDPSCGTADHQNRRTLLKMAGLGGLSWLTPISQALAIDAERNQRKPTAKSVIILWLNGAASQLETFDPHPGTDIAAESKARPTAVKGLQLGEGLEQTADLMNDISLVRSLTSKEGDHDRAVYNIKTGFRPDPTLVHPSIGSVVCHQLENVDKGKIDIPRHVSILADGGAGRGGYLGDQYDAFKMYDPKNPLPDLQKRVKQDRFDRRLNALEFLEQNDPFKQPKEKKFKFGDPNTQAALRMMSSDQLKAFDISEVPVGIQREFGDTPFGRGCLTALRLIQSGVRCVEVTLSGWDSHVNNHALQAGRIEILDPAFAALVRNLKMQDLFEDTIVLCGSEFGRTPEMNPAGGRDHWPHGFSMALAGGGIAGGRVVGETSPTPKLDPKNREQDLKNVRKVEDIHATVLNALGIDFQQELDTPVGRPMIISKGQVIKELLV